MIIIENIAKKEHGINKYELKVNHKVIASFHHNREDDTVACLRKAAEVVELERQKEKERLATQNYDKLMSGDKSSCTDCKAFLFHDYIQKKFHPLVRIKNET